MSAAPVLPTTATCDVCVQPITDEYLLRRRAKRHRGACLTRWRSERSRRFYHENRAKRIAYAANRRASDPVKAAADRRQRLLLRYGLTPEAYAEMFAAQGGLCAICRRPETRLTKDGLPTPLSVDHSHDTEAVRGLLCARCNGALGFIEMPGWMAAARAYLAAASRKESSS